MKLKNLNKILMKLSFIFFSLIVSFGLNGSNFFLNSSIYDACDKDMGDRDPAISILRNNFEIEHPNEMAFLKAIDKNDEEQAKKLIDKIDVNTKNWWGQPLLHYAVYCRRVNIIKMLLAKPNLNINIQNDSGDTALEQSYAQNPADIENNKDTIILLLRAGIDKNISRGRLYRFSSFEGYYERNAKKYIDAEVKTNLNLILPLVLIHIVTEYFSTD